MSENRPSAEVLGKLLAALETFDLLPDVERMAQCLHSALREVPGVTDASVCLYGRVLPAARPGGGLSDARCPSAGGLSPSAPPCTLKDRPDVRMVDVRTPRRAFGCLLLVVDDEVEALAYMPFLGNIGHVVATILENRDNARMAAESNAQLSRAVDELEDYVKERTNELESANVALKRHELVLERANRALRTLSACSQALLHAEGESELLDAVCRIIVEAGGYRMAWVGYPEHDRDKTVRPMAKFGREDGYLAARNLSWAETAPGHGLGGSAIRTGMVQVNQHFRTQPALAPYREEALKRGYHSGLGLPLRWATGMVGALTIYASEPDAFDESEVELLMELADDVSRGIDSLRTHAERDRIATQHRHHAEVLRQSLEDSIAAIASTLELRDPYTAGHQRRVGVLAAAIARDLGLAEEAVRGIELAATVHDVGKIVVPAEILSKPGRPTESELVLIRGHAQAGYETLKGIKFPWPIAVIVRQHHERLDGSGYPLGLKGHQILVGARIIAVADVVEAMGSHRPYRAALGIDVALGEIEKGRGTLFDPAVVESCVRLFKEKGFSLPSQFDRERVTLSNLLQPSDTVD